MGQDIANGWRHPASQKARICDALFSGLLDRLLINHKFYRQRVMHNCLFLFAALLITLRFWILRSLPLRTQAIHLVYLVISLIEIGHIILLLVHPTNSQIWMHDHIVIFVFHVFLIHK